VLFNLAVNARDAMPNGGELRISTRNCVLSKQKSGDDLSSSTEPPPLRLHRDDIAPPGSAFVQLAVTDNGVGMTVDVKKHIFEPFFTTKKAGLGTGLGLATVYGIVQQSKGHIDVISAVGAGTTFEILLPRSDATPVETARSPLLKATGSETILLVEDDEQVRLTALRVLHQHGYKVLAHANAEDVLALDPLILQQARLLVTDVVLVGINGFALAAMLCDQHAHLKVLFVSGYTREAMNDRGIATNNGFFLQKPFDAASLLAHVRDALDSKTPPAATSDVPKA
jgi:CheY-like chemotaxis protein